MLKELVSAVRGAYSGQAAWHHVAALSRYHRVQASPGFRAAAQYCLEQLRSWGVEAEILSFPADERTTYWSNPMFQEWEATEATLHLVEPGGSTRRLADYREDPISLIQRSLPFEGEAEIAVVEGGGSEEDYAGVDVAGKLVLAQGDVGDVYRLAVQKRGALGILYDGMRELPPIRQRIDLPDVRQYTSFWWRSGDEPKCFGFALTPRQGDELRLLARRRHDEGQGRLRARARVVSRLYDGHLEVVAAVIPGRTGEESLLVAHLCHPQASANDNASGAAAILEAAHTLRTLISSGRLPQPRRSIRLLWVPEMTGTYAYLATHEDECARMVAGLNLDMVGQNQALCESSFVVERPPEAMASFAGDLAVALREALEEGAPSLGGGAALPLYRQAVTPFSGGSDHYILSDPTVGVPTPMLIQWPDKFYHTSADTIDKVDARMLAVTGGLATAFAYFVAAAGEAEARWLAREIVGRARASLARVAQEGYTAAGEAASAEALSTSARRALRLLAFRTDRTVVALQSLGRLASGLELVLADAERDVRASEEQERLALQRDLSRLGQAPEASPPGPVDEWEQKAHELVLRRLYRGPIEVRGFLARLSEEDRLSALALARAHEAVARTLPVLMAYWLDGKRSLLEIADLVECESGKRDVEFMVRLAGLMARAGLLERVSG